MWIAFRHRELNSSHLEEVVSNHKNWLLVGYIFFFFQINKFYIVDRKNANEKHAKIKFKGLIYLLWYSKSIIYSYIVNAMVRVQKIELRAKKFLKKAVRIQIG